MELKDLAYKDERGICVRGTAAFLHYVFRECGGLDKFLEKHGKHIIITPVTKKNPQKVYTNVEYIASIIKKFFSNR